ncbi:putative metal-binding motif-containing protein [Myxococcota bacterium]|nr:putative metal-binding motif-containing protein [Myxococcota bacterium]
MRPWKALLFMLAGCLPELPSEDKDGVEDSVPQCITFTDADGDGYGDPNNPVTSACEDGVPSGAVEDNTDCDDAVADVNPAGTERCDGVDNNCDGATDGDDAVDRATWYLDGDGDGYGLESDSVLACDQPEGRVNRSLDCDDSDVGVNPEAVEVCDEVDQNCDGTVDNDASDAPTFYADNDRDGFGDPTDSLRVCSAPTGYVSDNTDCYDKNDDVRPDQTEYFPTERGDGSFDYNCDEAIVRRTTAYGLCSALCLLTQEGWADSPTPDCGETDDYVEGCKKTSPTTCEEVIRDETMSCI